MESSPEALVTAKCVECGQVSSQDRVIRIGDANVCASCKPLFLQKLTEGIAPSKVTPIYFPVSVTKLILLSIASFGIYEIYWFYKNWSLESTRTKESLWPFWRAIFAALTAYSLFHRMYDFAGHYTGNKFGLSAATKDRVVIPFKGSPAVLAASFFILIVTSRLPDPYSIISIFSVVPLAVVQQSVIKINRTYAPDADRNEKFSVLNIVVLVLGGLLFLLITMAAFLVE
jgi:hypothetical protein